MTCWHRVTKKQPCPICGKPDWCTYDDSGARCCMRVESGKLMANGGWLHKDNSQAIKPAAYHAAEAPIGGVALDGLNAVYVKAARKRLAEQAVLLGVTEVALQRLSCGWDGEALTFPMRDAAMHILGIRRRFPDGHKSSFRGGHEGLFIPLDLKGNRAICVCEGPTDTAAMLSIGCNAVGRPSCRGGVKLIIEVCKAHDVYIFPDRDPPGREGAFRLRQSMASTSGKIVIVEPPASYKDVREWIKAGAKASDISKWAGLCG